MIKRLTKFFSLGFACALWTTLAVASQRSATLRAINLVENPTNHTRPGSKGELGPYQFLPRTWQMHTRVPFRQAIIRQHSDVVAVKHYEWIKTGLVAAGIDPSPFNIALAWNCGLAAVTAGRAPSVSYSYAERVQNLTAQMGGHIESVTPSPAALASTPTPQMFVLDTSGGPKFLIAANGSAPMPTVRTAQTWDDIDSTATMPVVNVSAGDTVRSAFSLGNLAAPRLAVVQ